MGGSPNVAHLTEITIKMDIIDQIKKKVGEYSLNICLLVCKKKS